jgi:hypothetical protein
MPHRKHPHPVFLLFTVLSASIRLHACLCSWQRPSASRHLPPLLPAADLPSRQKSALVSTAPAKTIFLWFFAGRESHSTHFSLSLMGPSQPFHLRFFSSPKPSLHFLPPFPTSSSAPTCPAYTYQPRKSFTDFNTLTLSSRRGQDGRHRRRRHRPSLPG